MVFNGSLLGRQQEIPAEFVWPEEELSLPVTDLRTFLAGDPTAINSIPQLVCEACERHGFFLVADHGVMPELLAEDHHGIEAFFSLPLSEKQRAQRRNGESYGYASSFTGRFSSKQPWKETLSFRYCSSSDATVSEYFISTMGEDFRHFG